MPSLPRVCTFVCVSSRSLFSAHSGVNYRTAAAAHFPQAGSAVRWAVAVATESGEPEKGEKEIGIL